MKRRQTRASATMADASPPQAKKISSVSESESVEETKEQNTRKESSSSDVFPFSSSSDIPHSSGTSSVTSVKSCLSASDSWSVHHGAESQSQAPVSPFGYFCTCCNFSTDKNSMLDEHMEQHILKCPWCHYSSLTHQDVIHHCKFKHDKSTEIDSQPCYACVFCDFKTYVLVSLETHTALKHTGLPVKYTPKLIAKHVSAKVRIDDAVSSSSFRKENAFVSFINIKDSSEPEHTVSQHPVESVSVNDTTFLCVRKRCQFSSFSCTSYQKHLTECCADQKTLTVLENIWLKSTIMHTLDNLKNDNLSPEDNFSRFASLYLGISVPRYQAVVSVVEPSGSQSLSASSADETYSIQVEQGTQQAKKNRWGKRIPQS